MSIVPSLADIERQVMKEKILMKIEAMPADPYRHPSHCPPGIYEPIIETLCGTLCNQAGRRDVEISSEMRRILQIGGVPTDAFAPEKPLSKSIVWRAPIVPQQ